MSTVMLDILVDGQRVREEWGEWGERGRSSVFRDSVTSPHTRSSSFRHRPRPQLLSSQEDEGESGPAHRRPRTNSLPDTQGFLALPDPSWMTPSSHPPPPPPPSPSLHLAPPSPWGGTGHQDAPLCRVRSFKTTSKGIVNRGDSFKRSTRSLLGATGTTGDLHQGRAFGSQGHINLGHGSQGHINLGHGSQGHVNLGHSSQGENQGHVASSASSPSASPRTSSPCPSSRRRHQHHHHHGDRQRHRHRHHHHGSDDDDDQQQQQQRGSDADLGEGWLGHDVTHDVTPSFYRVLMMGVMGSGKSALTRQFMTSEYKGTFETSAPDADTDGMTVSVLLDGEESVLQFIDEELHTETETEAMHVDAYVVVFSVADLDSYDYAASTLRRLREESGLDRAIILVGNKTDLVRQRRVNRQDACRLAEDYDSRYTETSAALNQQVDELLVGVLSQIRLQLRPPPPSPPSSPSSSHRDHHPPGSPPSRPHTSPPSSPSPVRAALSFLQRIFGHRPTARDRDKVKVKASREKVKAADALFVT